MRICWMVPVAALAVTFCAAGAAAQDVPPPGPGEPGTWIPASQAFDPSTRTFINNQFVEEFQAAWYDPHVIMAFSADECPEGWKHLTDDTDEEPLYYAFGLFVDRHGKPRSEFVRMPACVKQ